MLDVGRFKPLTLATQASETQCSESSPRSLRAIVLALVMYFI